MVVINFILQYVNLPSETDSKEFLQWTDRVERGLFHFVE